MKLRLSVLSIAFAAVLLHRDVGVAAQCVTCSPSQCGDGGSGDNAAGSGNHGNAAARCATFPIQRSHVAQGKQGPKVGAIFS